MIACILQTSNAQAPDELKQDFAEWPNPLKKAEKGKYNTKTGVVITINGVTGSDLTNFLQKSAINAGSATKTLKELAALNLVKVDAVNKKVTININAEINQIEGFGNGTLTAVLDKNGDKIAIKVNSDSVVVTEGKVPEKSTGAGPIMENGPYFIPTPEMEAHWAGRINAKQFIKLNYHTRWAIVYDFSKEDPVSIYKRLNTVIGSTCDEIVEKEGAAGKKDKQHKVTSAPREDELDSALAKTQKSVLDNKFNLSKEAIRKVMDSLNRQAASATTMEQLEKIDRQLKQLRIQADIVKELYSGGSAKTKKNNDDPIQCDNIYKIKEVRKLSPTVNRSLLLVIPHYHPYRDSIVLSANYGDRFLQDAALFNSTFVGSTGAGTQAQAKGTEKEKFDEHVLIPGGVAKEELSPLVLFTKLRDELKEYTNEKMKLENLDVKIVENGVAYIKERMTALLDITDFTATGLLKAAELKSKGVDTNKQDEYFEIVHEAVDLFLKVAGYKRYDNHNLLIENKDLISLTLNRYRDGKLVTMNKETVRTYYTAGGVKVDFSVGLFGSSLVDKNFTTKTEWFRDTAYVKRDDGTEDTARIAAVDSVQRKRILKEDKGTFNIGPAILTHIYWRSGTDVNFSATVGIAINQQALPRYLFGGSVMFGRDSRWVFSSGVALGPVKDLAGGYKVDDVVELNELNTIPLKDVWKSAWFLSLTFNMGGFNVGGR
jgi:hypothetical protein